MNENQSAVVGPELLPLRQSGNNVFSLHDLLQEIDQEDNLSDIHLGAGEYLTYRYNGDIIKRTEIPPLTNEAVELVLKSLMERHPENFSKFWSEKDMDFSFVSKGGVPYRVNVYIKRGRLAIVMRKMFKEAKKLEDLMYQDLAQTIEQKILTKQSGLFLVTGPTGSGKSTSLVAMLEHINHTRNDHIITIEDPIEYIFEGKQSLFSQRELEKDTWSFENALRAAMREDPDVIFVGEIRDKDTAEAVLNMAETGHLVFSTLHTNDAATTINRYISFFSPDIQANIADRLSTSLVGVLSQFLVKTSDQHSRVGLFELMLNNTSIRNNISQKEIMQIQNIIETSSQQGMITHQQYAQRLLDQQIINPESVSWLTGKK